MTILEAMDDPALFKRWFADPSWARWRIFLKALFALFDHPSEDERAIYTEHTGRTALPTEAAREAWCIVGRRGGKSRIAALLAVYLACFKRYEHVLAPGEVGTLAIVAADRRQARTILRYINGFLDGVPMLAAMVANRTKETIELDNRVTIEVHTASFRTLRGYSFIGAILDEVAFFQGSDDGAANPDSEIVGAIRPGLASVPGSILIGISSPFARRGVLFEMYQRHHGVDGDRVLTFQGASRQLNPTLPEHVVADALEEDEASARAEWLGLFRSDVESFVSLEALKAVIIPGRTELPPNPNCQAYCFTDPSGGTGKDSWATAIGHREADGRIVVDRVIEIRPPFNPDVVTRDVLVPALRAYNVTSVTGDRYAGAWPSSRLAAHGISYRESERSRSELYRDALPVITAQRCELPDIPRLTKQFLSLDVRTGRSGRLSIDSARNGHEDMANAVAGLLCLAAKPRASAGTIRTTGW